MKKTMTYTLAATMAFSAVSAVLTPVMAKTSIPEKEILDPVSKPEEEKKIEIKNAQDFILNFHSVKKPYVKGEKLDPNSKGTILWDKEEKKLYYHELITKVDATNFSVILEGKKVFDTLTPLLQEEICSSILKDTEKEYLSFVEDALKEEEIYLQQQEEKEDSKEDQEEIQKPEQLPSGEDDQTDPEEGTLEDGDLKQEDTIEEPDTTVPTEEVSSLPEEKEELQEPVLMNQLPVLQESSMPILEEQVSTSVQLLEPVSAPVVQKQEDLSAQTFIDTYLKSANGNIFSTANTLNYQKILDAMSAWNSLTSAQRAGVNSILRSKIGKSYNQLLQEAQSIRLNGPSYSSSAGMIDTATQQNTGLYGALAGLSFAFFGFLVKKQREQ